MHILYTLVYILKKTITQPEECPTNEHQKPVILQYKFDDLIPL